MASNHLPEWQQHTPVINKTIEIPLRSLPVVRKTWNIRKLTLSLASSFFECIVQPQERNMTAYLTRTQLSNDISFCNLHKVYWLSFIKNHSQAAICFLDELLFAVQPWVRFWPWNQKGVILILHMDVYRMLAWLCICVDRSRRRQHQPLSVRVQERSHRKWLQQRKDNGCWAPGSIWKSRKHAYGGTPRVLLQLYQLERCV